MASRPEPVDSRGAINRDTLRALFRIPIQEAPTRRARREPERLALVHQDATGMGFVGAGPAPAVAGTATNASDGGGRARQRPVRVESAAQETLEKFGIGTIL